VGGIKHFSVPDRHASARHFLAAGNLVAVDFVETFVVAALSILSRPFATERQNLRRW
jgi:hypothetical protein